MGLLDDAIREHLDLKRRHGADPSEVERAEREALGPVRRNREPGDSPEPENGAAGTGAFAYDQDEDPGWSGDDPREPSAPGEASATREAPREPTISDDDLAPPDFATGSPPADDGGRGTPFDAEREAPRPRGRLRRRSKEPEPAQSPEDPLSDMSGGETVEYDVDDALVPRDEDREDVLEETPEFLQDTPDHDRLWFEQRPPRDFDFDG